MSKVLQWVSLVAMSLLTYDLTSFTFLSLPPTTRPCFAPHHSRYQFSPINFYLRSRIHSHDKSHIHQISTDLEFGRISCGRRHPIKIRTPYDSQPQLSHQCPPYVPIKRLPNPDLPFSRVSRKSDPKTERHRPAKITRYSSSMLRSPTLGTTTSQHGYRWQAGSYATLPHFHFAQSV